MPQIRGAFPLPISNAFEGMGRIQLVSGASFYLPAGSYLIATDANSVIEVWDAVETSWRTFVAASNAETIATDGFNFRARNTTGSLASVAIANAGSGMTNGIGPGATGVSLAVSGGTQATTNAQTPTLYGIVGGQVTAPTITRAGSGFVAPPLIVIDPPPVGGIQATAVASVSATGTISAITMVNQGAGYVATPNFYVIPQSATYQGGPPGGPTSGLTAGAINPPGLVDPSNIAPNTNTQADSTNGVKLTPVALVGSGTLTGVGIINFGGGYTATTAPTITISGGAGGVSATATLSSTVATNALIRSQPRVQ